MSDFEIELLERVKALEVKQERFEAIESKLDELLELKSKGMGAFWLASIIVGTIFSVVGGNILDWVRG